MIEPTIAGQPLADWEDLMQRYEDERQELRGLRIDYHDGRGRTEIRREYLPTDPWLGLREDGSRITMRDLGWT